jgi:nucleoid-associated protein YgaU
MTTAALWTSPLRTSETAPISVPDLSAYKLRQAANDPRALSAAILVGLVLVVGFRHPLAHALGTAGSTPALVGAPTKALVDTSPLVLPRSDEANAPAVPLHAPRDPFAAMSAAHATKVTTGVAQQAAPGSATAYRVRRGDSLWSIARGTVSGLKSDAILSATWRAIYADNRDVIGSNPGVLHVGVIIRIRPAA